VRTFRRDGIYRRRWFWYYPWGLTRWWLPGISRGGDEWCNDSVVLKVPPVGALCIFWRPGRLRTIPCPAEWEDSDDETRADYAPCGVYWNGRISERGHIHWDGGVCDEARKWLDSLALRSAP